MEIIFKMRRRTLLPVILVVLALGQANTEDVSHEDLDTSHEDHGSVRHVTYSQTPNQRVQSVHRSLPAVHSFRSAPSQHQWASHHRPRTHHVRFRGAAHIDDSNEYNHDDSSESRVRVSHFKSSIQPVNTQSHFRSVGHSGIGASNVQVKSAPLVHFARAVDVDDSNEVHDNDNSHESGVHVAHFKSSHTPNFRLTQTPQFRTSNIRYNLRDSIEHDDDGDDDVRFVSSVGTSQNLHSFRSAQHLTQPEQHQQSILSYRTLVHSDSDEHHSAEDFHVPAIPTTYHSGAHHQLGSALTRSQIINTHDSHEVDDSLEVHHVNFGIKETKPAPAVDSHVVQNIQFRQSPPHVVETPVKHQPVHKPYSYSLTFGHVDDDSVEVTRPQIYQSNVFHHQSQIKPQPQPTPQTYQSNVVHHQPQIKPQPQPAPQTYQSNVVHAHTKPQIEPQPISYSVQYGIERDDSTEFLHSTVDDSYVGFGLRSEPDSLEATPVVIQPQVYEVQNQLQPEHRSKPVVQPYSYNVRFGQKIDVSGESQEYIDRSDEVIAINTHEPDNLQADPVSVPQTYQSESDVQKEPTHSGFSYQFRVGQHFSDSHESQEDTYVVQTVPQPTLESKIPPTPTTYQADPKVHVQHVQTTDQKQHDPVTYSFRVGLDTDSVELHDDHDDVVLNIGQPWQPSTRTSDTPSHHSFIKTPVTFIDSVEDNSAEDGHHFVVGTSSHTGTAGHQESQFRTAVQQPVVSSFTYRSSNEENLENSDELHDTSHFIHNTYSAQQQQQHNLQRGHGNVIQYSANTGYDSHEDDDSDGLRQYVNVHQSFRSNQPASFRSHQSQPVLQNVHHFSNVVHNVHDSNENDDDDVVVHRTYHSQPLAQSRHSSVPVVRQSVVQQHFVSSNEHDFDGDDDHDNFKYQANFESKPYSSFTHHYRTHYDDDDHDDDDDHNIQVFKAKSLPVQAIQYSSYSHGGHDDHDDDDEDGHHLGAQFRSSLPSVHQTHSAHTYGVNPSYGDDDDHDHDFDHDDDK